MLRQCDLMAFNIDAHQRAELQLWLVHKCFGKNLHFLILHIFWKSAGKNVITCISPPTNPSSYTWNEGSTIQIGNIGPNPKDIGS